MTPPHAALRRGATERGARRVDVGIGPYGTVRIAASGCTRKR